jgi:predicted DNA-binding protein (UPF0251 family)
MPRPFACRKVSGGFPVCYYKPQGIPMRMLEEVSLALDEMEALRLADFEGMYQAEAAEKMGVSRQTFGNIVKAARRKVAEALVSGKAIKIETQDSVSSQGGEAEKRYIRPAGNCRFRGGRN